MVDTAPAGGTTPRSGTGPLSATGPPRDTVALVSGGAGGIGHAVTRALAAGGRAVVAVGRDAERLAALEHECRADGLRVDTRVCDITDPEAVAALAGDVGEVGVLVNNAGTSETAPLVRTSLGSWDRQMQVNATAAFLLTREFLPGMTRRGWGRLVFVASTAAVTGTRYTAAYTASKHALLGLARATAAEVAGSGVTSNAVCPTFVRTPMTRRSVARISERTGRDATEAEAALAASSPLGRLLEPEEVAAAVAFLAGEQSAAINGQSLIIDGGGIHS
jgi:NAD(P)-dependent dehydrogenase (short-subunit alcohol dehydrogenase family)